MKAGKLTWTVEPQLRSAVGQRVCWCILVTSLHVFMHTCFLLISFFFLEVSHLVLPFALSFFLPLRLSFSSLSSGFQECTECPYLCPCKHKGEPGAEAEFLCRSQAARPRHTLASRRLTAIVALSSYYYKIALKRLHQTVPTRLLRVNTRLCSTWFCTLSTVNTHISLFYQPSR